MSDDDRRRWNERYRRGSHASDEPSPFLRSVTEHLPRQGRALDVAGGAGRHALWLAARGLDVTLADVADEALTLAAQRAEQRGLWLRTLQRDLAEEGLPPGPWEVIVSIRFLERKLWPQYATELAPGGWLVMAQPTVDNLARHEKPPRRFLLERGELEAAFSALETVSFIEGWTDDGHHEAQLLARRAR